MSALSVLADNGAAQRGDLIGVAPVEGPDIARAANGDTLELVGSGTFTPGTDQATGFGSFVHKNAAGDTLAEGSWIATKLLRFRSYGSGSAPGAPKECEGGRAFISIHLSPFGAESGFNAVLLIACLFGDRIPAGAAEGIQLRVSGGPKFTKQVSGETLFIKLQRSEDDNAAPAPADLEDLSN